MSAFKIFGGSLLFAAAVNLFIAPLNLFNGGIVGTAQLIRSFLNAQGFAPGFDIAGIINLFLNLPLFFLAYKGLSKRFFVGTLCSVGLQAIFFSLIPIPQVPILDDVFASCVIGGILSGAGVGLVLQTKACAGGTDILGVYAAIKWKSSVGQLQLYYNMILYAICAAAFDLSTAVYSIIYCVIMSFTVDKVHLQNIEVSLMIFTKKPEIKELIMKKYVRGVTYWKGMGAYTNTETEVLMTIVSKYEIDSITKEIKQMDPNAFIVVNEQLKVDGSFEKRLV